MLPSELKRFKGLLHSALDLVHTKLSDIENAAHQQEKSAREDAQSREEKQRKERVMIARAIVRAARTVPKYEERQRAKEHSLQWKMFWVTLFAAVAATSAAIGAFIYADIAKRQLKEFQKQNALMKQQIIGSFGAQFPDQLPRPETIESDVNLAKYRGMNVFFDNIGKVTSPKLDAEATLMRMSLPDYRVVGVPERKSVHASNVRPYEVVPPTIPGLTRDEVRIGFALDSFTKSDLDQLNSLGEVVQIKGHAEFSDGFGETHARDFCYIYAAIPRHQFVNGPTTGGAGGGWGRCDGMVPIISQALKWEKHR